MEYILLMTRGTNGSDKLFIHTEKEEVKAIARTFENNRMGAGSLAERLQRGQREGRYSGGVNSDIPDAPEFAVKETRPVLPITLLNFPKKDMTEQEVRDWLAGHPEYDHLEMAEPEHLDALKSNPLLAEITKEESMWIVALGASTAVAGEREVARLSAWEDGGRLLDLHWADKRWSR